MYKRKTARREHRLNNARAVLKRTRPLVQLIQETNAGFFYSCSLRKAKTLLRCVRKKTNRGKASVRRRKIPRTDRLKV